MIDELLGGVGSKLADRAAAALFSPAFVFLAVGVAAWVSDHGGGAGWHELQVRFQNAGAATLVVLVVAVLLLLLSLGALVQRLTLPILRALEGYWPRQLNGARQAMVKRLRGKYDRDESRFQALAAKRDHGALTTDENEEYVRLEDRLDRFPADPDRFLPTRLGNILRASESRPLEKYGLDAPRVWTQLYLVLPETTKTEVLGARARLDQSVAAVIWSTLAVVWTVWAWWVLPLAVLATAAAFRWWVLESAARYGEIVEAAFDVNRFLLYGALRMALPANPKAEHDAGTELTKYLVRGSDSDAWAFEHTPPAGNG